MIRNGTNVTEGVSYIEGNVGIGTTTPSEILEVDGNIKVGGDIFIDSVSMQTLIEDITMIKAILGLGPVIDIDGNIYQTVKIGDQIWMAGNLKVTHFPDGSVIPLVEDNAYWNSLETNELAYCWYNNEINNRDLYGGLYTWAAAMNGQSSSIANPSQVQGICPDGWHLPSDAEWTQLFNFLGGTSVAGGKLKEAGTINWSSPNTGATNESGFTALPSGLRYPDGGFISEGGSHISFIYRKSRICRMGIYAEFWQF